MISQSLRFFEMKIIVIPAAAGIQILAGLNKGEMSLKLAMDSHLRGNDNGELINYGIQLSLPKLGFRFSRKAFLPSFASSVI